MSTRGVVILLAVALGVSSAWGQAVRREPHIGYVYPAGGRQGTTFQVVVGGQFLGGASNAYVSGDGVHVTVVQHYPPMRNLDKEQRTALVEKMRSLFRQRRAELMEGGGAGEESAWRPLTGPDKRRSSKEKMEEGDSGDETVELPQHPLLRDLEKKSLRELLHVRHMLEQLRKGQRNMQLAESVLLEVTVDRDADLGDRELRINTRGGLTNPLVFCVGNLSEVCELEVGDEPILDALPKERPLELPVMVNGQIMPGDVDRVRFSAKQGQRLVIETHARELIPYLADAVPGWFQATLSLYDAAGEELAFADDYRFSPDPVLCYDVPADGEYELEIRDSIYRGREDFVYRISIGARPFITSIFPLGCRAGQKRYVSVDGWNLPVDRLFLDGRSDVTPGIRQKPLGHGKATSNPVAYEVSNVRAVDEIEDNNTAAEAQQVRPPTTVDGHIGDAGDVDMFSFEGHANYEIVVEVTARRVNSPLDSLVRLIDSSGNVVAWNDDYEHKDGYLHTAMGVQTHDADSYLRTRLPADGVYYAQVADAQSHGGPDYAYRVRISPPQPDFELRATPSSLSLRAGLSSPLCVHVLRKDGFDGEIELSLADGADGFTLSGARIPPGRDRVRLTVNAPPKGADEPVKLALVGHARIGGKDVTRRVVPAEDMMQAFLYRHLTPSQELVAVVQGGRRLGSMLKPADDGVVQIPAGGVASVRIVAPPRAKILGLKLTPSEPPPGITVKSVKPIVGGWTVELAADGDAAPVGYADNLIVEASMEVPRRGKDGEKTSEKQRIAIGVLPAIPFEVVSK